MPNPLFRQNLTDAARQSFFIVLVSLAVGVSVNLIRTDPIPFFKDWSVQGKLTLENGETLAIPLSEAASLFHDNRAVFLDARNREEFDQGHIKGAKNLPWYMVDDLFAEVAADLDPDALIITYCDGEACPLSHDLALFLKNMGFSRVRVLVNGWTLWQDNHLPVEGSFE